MKTIQLDADLEKALISVLDTTLKTNGLQAVAVVNQILNAIQASDPSTS